MFHQMTADELHHRVAGRLPDTVDADGRKATHEVLAAIAERLSPSEAAELGAELPEELGDVLAHANGDGELTRDQLIEDIASRLDLDDDDAEHVAQAVLSVIREALEPLVAIER